MSRTFKVQAIAGLAVLCLFNECRATTIVTIVTKHGIVICADGKVTKIAHEEKPRVLDSWVGEKAFIIRKRFVIYHGLRDFTGQRQYSSDRIIEELPNDISTTHTLLEIADLVRNKLQRQFEGFDVLPKSGKFIKRHLPAPPHDLITTFAIVGYDRRIPRIYEVSVKMDWDKREHVIPPIRPSYPNPGRKNLHGIFTGLVAEIQELWNDSTATYKKARATNRAEVDALTLDQDLDLAHMSIASRMMVKIEIDAHPQYVGYPLRVITIPQGGRITTQTYDK